MWTCFRHCTKIRQCTCGAMAVVQCIGMHLFETYKDAYSSKYVAAQGRIVRSTWMLMQHLDTTFPNESLAGVPYAKTTTAAVGPGLLGIIGNMGADLLVQIVSLAADVTSIHQRTAYCALRALILCARPSNICEHRNASLGVTVLALLGA
jgi:hypothetical protein